LAQTFRWKQKWPFTEPAMSAEFADFIHRDVSFKRTEDEAPARTIRASRTLSSADIRRVVTRWSFESSKTPYNGPEPMDGTKPRPQSQRHRRGQPAHKHSATNGSCTAGMHRKNNASGSEQTDIGFSATECNTRSAKWCAFRASRSLSANSHFRLYSCGQDACFGCSRANANTAL
jgi:hypothetical protein